MKTEVKYLIGLSGAVVVAGLLAIGFTVGVSRKPVIVTDLTLGVVRGQQEMTLETAINGDRRLIHPDGTCIFNIRPESTVATVCSNAPHLDSLRVATNTVRYHEGDRIEIFSSAYPLSSVMISEVQ